MKTNAVKINCFSCARWDIKRVDKYHIVAHCTVDNRRRAESETCEKHIFISEVLKNKEDIKT